MKRIVLLILVLVVMIFTSCNKEVDEELAGIMNKGVNVQVAPVVIDEQYQEEKEVSQWPMYYDGEYEWTIEFIIHTNDHHPRGHVVFTKIHKYIADEKEVWTIDYLPNMYIEEVHYNLKAKRNGGYEEENVFLPQNEDFRNAFRTTEAIYLGWLKVKEENPADFDNRVPMSYVIKARERMEGRQHGISR